MSSVSSTPPVDQALLPAAIRNGTKERQAEYQSALSFERVLVGQMTAQLMKTSSGDEDSESAAVSAMKDSLPGTLADALMAGGGIGLAAQLDASWHPATATSLSSGATTTAGTDTTPAEAGAAPAPRNTTGVATTPESLLGDLSA